MSEASTSRQKLFEIMRLGPVWEARNQKPSEPISNVLGQTAVSGKRVLVVAHNMEHGALELTHEMFKCIDLKHPDHFEVVAFDANDKENIVAQIQAAQPRVIVVLGQLTFNQLLPEHGQFDEIRGKPFELTLNGTNYSVIVTEHPDVLFRWPLQKRQVWDDLLLIKTSLLL